MMPYVEGESLRDRLTRERQLPLEAARARAVELLGTYQASHGSLVGVVVHWWPGFASLRGYPPFEALLRDTPER